jgi:single-strand DNA-binding protein
MVNSSIFIGRVGQKPETRQLPSGDKLSTFSMALSEKYKDKNGERIEKTTWINCVVFGKQAEIVEQYVDKGSLLYIEAKYQLDVYEKDGVKMNAPKFVVKSFTMLGGKPDSEQSSSPQSAPSAMQPKPVQQADYQEDSDDLPF